MVEIVLTGDTFDDAYAKAVADAKDNQKAFIHPFDDEKVIAGQGTVGLEIVEQYQQPIDYVFRSHRRWRISLWPIYGF